VKVAAGATEADHEAAARADERVAELLDGVSDPRLAPYRPARFL